MGNLAVVNCAALSPYAFEPLPGGLCAFERAFRTAAALPDLASVLLMGGDRLPEAFRSPHHASGAVPVEIAGRAAWTVQALVEELVAAVGTTDRYTDLFYLFGDFPLYDLDLARRMHANHGRYFAEYTFADGYPVGLSLEILGAGAVRQLPRLLKAEDSGIERDTLFALIQRDINAFDIETELSPVDLRMKRVQLSCDTRRNHLLVRRLMEAGATDEPSVVRLVDQHSEMLRTLPAFAEVQVTDGVTQTVSYSAYTKLAPDAISLRNFMPHDRFRRIVDEVKQFADEAVVSLSLWGEPALHPELPEFVAEIARHDGLSALIETSGVGWRATDLPRIKEAIGERITWIVALDASNEALYRTLRGNGWAEANATIELLLRLFPNRVYVQATRITANEADLETFYRNWKERVPNVIIQKYDYVSGYLPQLKVTDISPVRRFPCWHLKRDLVVRLDGAVTMCREDLLREYILGNLFEESLAEIWRRGEALHARHVTEDYPPLCKACDEYYTYNF